MGVARVRRLQDVVAVQKIEAQISVFNDMRAIRYTGAINRCGPFGLRGKYESTTFPPLFSHFVTAAASSLQIKILRTVALYLLADH